MSKSDKEPTADRAPSKQGGGKNTDALAAALRANLLRRKARQRALRAREGQACEELESAAPDATTMQEDEAKWTE
jgi:hypothetical protein